MSRAGTILRVDLADKLEASESEDVHPAESRPTQPACPM